MSAKIRCVIYTRVSDPGQVDNMSLDDQEKHCKKFAQNRGWKVVGKTYREEGISGKDVKRVALKKLTKFCLDKKNKIDYVVIYKWWRFSRNLEKSLPLEALLARKGVKFISVTEPYQDNAFGRFTKNLNILLGQLDNEIKAEITTDNMKAKFNDGKWLWNIPIGYKKKYAKGMRPEGADNPILIHPKLGPVVTRVFELAETGQYTQAQLAREMNLLNFEKYYGVKAEVKHVGRIIKKSFYYGLMHVKSWDLYSWGDHPSLTDEITWRKANKYLFGTLKTYNPQDKNIYPLKRIMRCSSCGDYVKAYQNHKKKIHYYECKNPGCKGKSKLRIQAEEAHDHFVEMLSLYKPNARVMKLFESMVFNEWDSVIDHSRKRQKSIRNSLNKQDELIDIYLERYERGDYSKEKKDKKVEEAKIEIALLEEELEENKYEQYDKEKLRGFTEFFLMNLDRLWLRMDYQQKVILQQKLFPNGVAHNRQKFLTEDIDKLCSSIKLIREIADADGRLVTPRIVSLNRS